MAKRIGRKNGKDAAAHDDTEVDDDIGGEGKMPEPDVIKKHVAAINALKAQSAKVRGEIGAAVKNAESDHNVHRGAAALIGKLHGMDPSKRDEFLRHFDSYRLALGMGRQDNFFDDPKPDRTGEAAHGAV